MELNQIRYFLCLAETLNFTRAAEACGVTQPALTRAIQRLEEELGGALLYRERSLTRLTPLGEAMRGHLRTIADAAAAARDTADSIRAGGRDRLRVGLVPSLALEPFVPLLAEAARLRAAVEVEVRRGRSEDLFAALLEDGIDVALVADEDRIPDRLHRWPLFEEGFVVAMARDHALATLDRVPAPRLAGATVLRPLPDALDPAIVPTAGPAAESVTDAIALALAGMGVALLADRTAGPAALVTRPLDDPAARRRIMLTVVAGRPRAPAVEAFVRLARVAAWDLEAA